MWQPYGERRNASFSIMNDLRFAIINSYILFGSLRKLEPTQNITILIVEYSDWYV